MADRKERQRVRVQQNFPELFYRDGRFNVDTYQAAKQNDDQYREVMPSVKPLLGEMYGAWKFRQATGQLPQAPPDSAMPDLFNKLDRQYSRQLAATYRLEDDVREVKQRAKKHRQEGFQQVDSMRQGLQSRDRSPTRK